MSDLTITVGELLAAVPGLQAIGDVKIPSVIAAYALAKAKRKANPELETIEAQRVRLCEQHAEKDAAGLAVKIDGVYQFNGTYPEFAKDWKALLAEPVTLHGVRAVTVKELDGAMVSPDVLFSLGPFVSEAPESA
jgi:hypothetical protein